MKNNTDMEIKPQLEKAAAIDIHTRSMVICFYKKDELQEIKEYGTFTPDLERIRDDLLQYGIKDVLMESTGVYWMALYDLLSLAGIRARVVNARFVANAPKEKTDKKDAKWLCKLLVNGIVRSSYIAGEQQRSFRELCRQPTRYHHHYTQTCNRLLKNLERKNIKLRSVVSSVKTKSSLEIIGALANGETDIEKLVSMCKGRLRTKKDLMRQALTGVLAEHDRYMLKKLLDDLSHYQKQITDLDKRIEGHVDQVNKELINNLQTITGIAQKSTDVILSEIGDNVAAWSTPDQLAAWAGLAPGNKQTGGKSKPIAIRKGNNYLRTALVQAAWAAVRAKGNYWRACFSHLTKRMHAKKAIIVIARKLIKVIYKTIKYNRAYVEYGAEFFIERLLLRHQRPTLTIANA